MKKVLLLLSLSSLFFIPCFAQENISCPNIKIVVPNETYSPGDSIPFSISSSKELKDLKLEYLWRTSAGVIENGQGTTNILLSTYGLENLEITAIVEIKGLPQNCPNTFSETAIVGQRPRATDGNLQEKFDLSDLNEMKARIDGLYVALIGEPTLRGVIITYGTRKGIAKREAAIKKLIKFRRYNIKRIEFIRAIRTYRAKNQFFIVPQGEKSPVPEP